MEINNLSILELLENILEAWVENMLEAWIENSEHAAEISTFILNSY